MAGLAAGRACAAGSAVWPLAGALPAAILAIATAGLAPRLWACAIVVAMALGGLASEVLHRQPPPAWEDRPPREVRLSLRIERVFPSAENSSPTSAVERIVPNALARPRNGTSALGTTRSTQGLATVVRAGAHLQDLIGQKIHFSISLRRHTAAPVRSEVVIATGVLTQLPRRPAADSYDRSLIDQGLNYQLIRGRVLASEHPPTAYRRFCARLADRMNALLGAGLEHRPELAALYRAMLLGRKSELSADQRRLFLRTGSMHLFAVNGIHIGTVAVALHALLGLLRCPRPAATALVLAVLWMDVDTTGASPSAVRAFLMAAAVEAAWVLRRPANPIASLAIAALVVPIADPMDFFSASFQMSYGVMLAIVSLGLPLAAHWQKSLASDGLSPRYGRGPLQRLRTHAQNHLLGALGVGAAAAAVGAVTGVEFFNLFVPGGLLANLALVPSALLVIVAGVVSLAFGFTGATGVSRFFNRAAGSVLWGMTGFARAAAAVPGAYFDAHYRAAWMGPLALAALLGTCLFGYAVNWRRERGGFWPPFVIVMAVLGIGVKYG